MDFSIRDIIRETRASINARLDMLELLIQNGKPSIPKDQSNPVDLSRIELMIGSLYSKMEAIENKLNYNKDEELPSIILEEKEDNVKEILINHDEKEEEKEDNVKENLINHDEKEEEDVIKEDIVHEEEEVVEEQELTEFEYKGMVLYRDGDNKVYQMDEEGELVDTPIGVWNEAKQKVLRI